MTISGEPMQRSLRIMIVAIVLVFGSIMLWGALKYFFIKRYFSNFKPPAVAVETALATQQQWQPSFSVIGTVHAVQQIPLTTEVNGRVVSIHFREGQVVKKGDLLVQLNDRIDQADLVHNQVAADLAELSYRRYKKLLRHKAVAQADADQYLYRMKQTKAIVEKSKLIIELKAIKAPFTGHIGLRQVNKGQYLVPGTLIAHLYSEPPFQLHFSLPENQHNNLKVGQKCQVRLAEDGPLIATGVIQYIDVATDVETHQLHIKGLLDKKQDAIKQGSQLLPGQFVYITLQLGKSHLVTLIPKSAVTYRSYGRTVYLVEGDSPYVRQRPVTIGDVVGDQVIILKGVSPNDRVVISGQLRLYDGAHIKLVPTVKPS